MLRAGELRDRVTIQAETKTADGAGGWITGWADVADGTIAAKVEPITGGESFRAGIERATQFYRILVRYQDGLTTANRLMFNGALLNIRTCGDPFSTRERLVITAESGVAN